MNNIKVFVFSNRLDIYNILFEVYNSLEGTDPYYKSFTEKMVPFYNKFVPTLKGMDNLTSDLSCKTFCILFSVG